MSCGILYRNNIFAYDKTVESLFKMKVTTSRRSIFKTKIMPLIDIDWNIIKYSPVFCLYYFSLKAKFTNWYWSLNANKMIKDINSNANISKNMFLMKEKLRFYQIISAGEGAIDTSTYRLWQTG